MNEIFNLCLTSLLIIHSAIQVRFIKGSLKPIRMQNSSCSMDTEEEYKKKIKVLVYLGLRASIVPLHLFRGLT